MVSNTPATTALKPLTGGGFRQYTVCMYSINKSVKKHMPPLQSAAHFESVARTDSIPSLQSTDGRGACLPGHGLIRVHDFRHPAEMGKAEIEAYLMWLEINESDPLILAAVTGPRSSTQRALIGW